LHNLGLMISKLRFRQMILLHGSTPHIFAYQEIEPTPS
jgi:hypothetical protein